MKKIIPLVLLAFGCQSKTEKNDIYEDIKLLAKETQKVVSVEKGEKIDTAYFRTLFLPTARFTVVGEEDGKSVYETMNLDDFLITLSDDYYTNGYWEEGQGEIIERFKGIAQLIQVFHGKDSQVTKVGV